MIRMNVVVNVCGHGMKALNHGGGFIIIVYRLAAIVYVPIQRLMVNMMDKQFIPHVGLLFNRDFILWT
jgi:hypothetical protein